VPIEEELLEILVCPVCKKALEPSPAGDALVCRQCKLRYPIEDDIPILIQSAAEPLD
jgi:uncharacterized protein YbaR (Trm112 family)